jgi:hypothetical protein
VAGYQCSAPVWFIWEDHIVRNLAVTRAGITVLLRSEQFPRPDQTLLGTFTEKY